MEGECLKVAIPLEKGLIAEHFGRCESYAIYSIKKNKVVKKETIPNPGHRPFFLPMFLASKGVSIFLCKGMGPKAQMLCKKLNIKVFFVSENDTKKAVEKFLSGSLNFAKNVCEHL